MLRNKFYICQMKTPIPTQNCGFKIDMRFKCPKKHPWLIILGRELIFWSTGHNTSKYTSIRDSVKFKLSCPVDFSWISVVMKLFSKALISFFLIKAIWNCQGSIKGSHNTFNHYKQMQPLACYSYCKNEEILMLSVHATMYLVNVIVVDLKFSSDWTLNVVFSHISMRDDVPQNNFQKRSTTTPLHESIRNYKQHEVDWLRASYLTSDYIYKY